jgi:DNA N-6-adenine-methyltransferase (Dam)
MQGLSCTHRTSLALGRATRPLPSPIDADALSFPALDARIDEGLQTVANDWNDLLPYLLEMHRRLSAPGRRTDLRKGAPPELTWTAWVESKRLKLGRSLRSVQRLLRGKTEASQRVQARPRDTLSRGAMQDSAQIPRTAIEIATEMAAVALQLGGDGDSRAFAFEATTEDATGNWLSPPDLVKRLGHFDLDPCGSPGMPWKLAEKVYTPPQDGLSLPWGAGRPCRVWCNPPYGVHVWKWAQRMAAHGDGILLIFGRTETQAWQEHIWPFADAILFPHGRIRFCLPSGEQVEGGTAPSSLVAYGQGNVEALVNSEIAGALVFKARMILGTQASQL